MIAERMDSLVFANPGNTDMARIGMPWASQCRCRVFACITNASLESAVEDASVLVLQPDTKTTV